MNIEDIGEIENEEVVAFVYKPLTKTIAVTGSDEAIGRALTRLGDRDEVVKLLCIRQGISPEAIITREISATRALSLAVQLENYRRWFSTKSQYYQPSEEQLEKMWSALEEGDEVVFDFAHTITVRRATGLIIAVNRRGEIEPPSPYSPIVKRARVEREQISE